MSETELEEKERLGDPGVRVSMADCGGGTQGWQGQFEYRGQEGLLWGRGTMTTDTDLYNVVAHCPGL